jgi:hypothetical protein
MLCPALPVRVHLRYAPVRITYVFTYGRHAPLGATFLTQDYLLYACTTRLHVFRLVEILSFYYSVA